MASERSAPYRPATIVAVGLVVVILLAACDDSGLSKEEFIARADEICADVNAKTQELEQPRDPGEFTRFARRAQAITQQAVADLRELDPPEDDAALIDRMIDKIEEAVSVLPEIGDAVAAEDFQRVQELGMQVQDNAQEAQEIAQNYGFEECARGNIAPAAGG